jgi:type I restriction enzyme S subunit
VQAKIDGRLPVGVPEYVLPIFPAHFEDSKLGPIPKGWSTPTLGDVLELKRGYDLPATRRLCGGIPIVSSSGPSGFHNEHKVAGPGIVTGRYGTIGQVFLVRENFWPLNTTLYVCDFKGTNLFFAHHLLQNLDFHKFSDKAAVPGINRNHVHEELVVQPPAPMQARFGDIAAAWDQLAARLDAQTQTLASLRDTLLPALLSGEVTIKQAEKAVGELT